MELLYRIACIVLYSVSCCCFSVKRDARCGSTSYLTQNNGTIISHTGYAAGLHYGKEFNCTWVIQAPTGLHVEVVAKNFSVEMGASFCYDYVRLYDGNSIRSHSLGTFCGHHFEPISSSQEFLTIQFVTDRQTQLSGFELYYNFTHDLIRPCQHGYFKCDNGVCQYHSRICDGDDDCGDASDEKNCPAPTCSPSHFQCANHKCVLNSWLCDGDNDCGDGSDELSSTCNGGTLNPGNHSCGQLNYTGTNGTIQSPGFPLNYYQNMFCRYQIFAPNGTQSIAIEFDRTFSVQGGLFCSDDYLKVYSDGHRFTHGPFCGMQPPRHFTIPRRHVIIEFTSDSSVQDRGFKLTWKAS